MNRDDIIRMARDAGLLAGCDLQDERAQLMLAGLSQFATAVATAEREARQQAQREAEALRGRIVKSGLELHRAVRDAVKEEREACAQVCDLEAARWSYPSHANAAVTVAAAAIRARKETK